ncbi:hypothetical protein [Desulfovibrio sp. UCD-KL4C]|uniref:hypothetical protein n=1 Tax=Desulfovibrio sp. UCD-KL4C TaxID=2578120 RepID=UPI0025C41464|nr:hypothetical protein [Desulfovibrio sp. UCD-KL4C]
MAQPTGKFEAVVSILKKATTINWNKRTVIATIKLSDFTDILLFLDNESVLEQITIEEDTYNDELNKIIQQDTNSNAIVYIDTNYCGDIYENFDEFLSRGENKYIINDSFYCTEGGISSSSDSETVTAYKKTVALINLFRETADSSTNESVLFFSANSKIEITLNYSLIDLKEFTGNISELRDSLFEPIHRNERIAIFKSSLITMLGREPNKDLRFSYLLRNYTSWKETYENNFKLYLEKFTFESLRSEIEENKIKLADKLNSIISDLHKSIIALPLGFIFGATKLSLESEHIVNDILILGSITLFCLFQFIALANHRRILEFVSSEITRQKRKLITEHSSLAEELSTPYEKLDKRVRFQKILRRSFGLGLWLVIGICIATTLKLLTLNAHASLTFV